MAEWLILILKLSVGALILAIGMGSKFSELTYLWERPGLLFRSLLAMYVLVPLAAILLAMVFPMPVGGKAALLVLAVSAGAPLLPKKLGSFSSDVYIFSLVVTSSILAILIIPGWVALLARHFDVQAELSFAIVAKALAKAFLLPLAIGMLIRVIFPNFCERWSDRILSIVSIVLAVTGLVLLVASWRVLLEINLPGMVALLFMMLIALAIGHFLGGPKEDDRTVLAITCATRHIGIALVIATIFRGPKTAVVVAAYLLTSALVSIPYLRWRRKTSGERKTEPLPLST